MTTLTTGAGAAGAATPRSLANPISPTDQLADQSGDRADQVELRVGHLAEALGQRARAVGAHRPLVVGLGVADVTGESGGDIQADLRPTAEVHVAADAVLVGSGGAFRNDSAHDGTATPCGLCLAIRWQRLRLPPLRDALETGTEGRQVGPWPVAIDFVADAVWALVEHGRSAPDHRGLDSRAWVARVDLASLAVETTEFLAEPQCPAWHRPAGTAPTELHLRGGPYRGGPHGSHRLRAPADYGLADAGLIGTVSGVLGSRLVHDLLAPTTAAVSGHYMERARDGLHDIGFSGKADSFAASRDLALLEGLERYAGTRPRRRQEQIVASLAELTELGEAALDPRDCGEYPPETYRRDPSLRRFDPQTQIPWVWGHSLRDDRRILVPLRSAYYSLGTDADAFVFECSNGCAIGSCPEEAALSGLLELVERDAFLLGWYSGAPMTEIDLATVPGRGLGTMLNRAALHDYEVHVFDSRVDLSVPVVTALAIRRDRGPGTMSFAAGASLDPASAVTGALSEALTYLPHRRAEAERRHVELEQMLADPGQVRELADHALLFSHQDSVAHVRRYLEPVAAHCFGEVYAAESVRSGPHPGRYSRDLTENLRRLVAEVAAVGCDVIAVDQTTPEQARFGLCTVRVIAPGLLPIDFGWGRQRALTMPRLHTAHHRAGRLPGILTEADLHMVPHPFP
jgi:ribosomal protein S12 methylthiotransferase accessory factor